MRPTRSDEKVSHARCMLCVTTTTSTEAAVDHVRITIDSDDRRSRRVVDAITELVPTVAIRDARDDDDAATFLASLVCSGRLTPVLEVGGLMLTAPSPADAVDAVRKKAPDLVA